MKKKTEIVDLSDKVTKLRMKALQIGLADSMLAYILAFN